MGKKRRYQTTAVKRVHVDELAEEVRDQRVTIGVDVAKEAMVAAVMDEGQAVLCTVRWSHPVETEVLLDLAEALREQASDVEVAMEPSGVYGDALRWQFLRRNFEVFRVSPKKTHDMAEVYDGVPSKHDAKDAAIVAKLHFDSASEPWPLKSDRERQLAAALRMLEVHHKQFRQNRNRLEGLLARHWPELTRWLDLDSATLLELLKAYGGPAAVAANPDVARDKMRSIGRSRLSADKIAAVVASAARTAGMPQIDEEVSLLSALATEARRNQQALKAARRHVEELAVAEGSTRELQATVGKTTAAVLVASAGDPKRYDSPQSYVKALGLNLREHSSGKKKGQLHITKRGSGTARMFLFLAALRKVKDDPIVRAWYAKKVAREGGKAKTKAIVAIMRKLVMALWHVARGHRFDASKLYDVRRLAVSS